jgi:hypothetical protein
LVWKKKEVLNFRDLKIEIKELHLRKQIVLKAQEYVILMKVMSTDKRSS